MRIQSGTTQMASSHSLVQRESVSIRRKVSSRMIGTGIGLSFSNQANVKDECTKDHDKISGYEDSKKQSSFDDYLAAMYGQEAGRGLSAENEEEEYRLPSEMYSQAALGMSLYNAFSISMDVGNMTGSLAEKVRAAEEKDSLENKGDHQMKSGDSIAEVQRKLELQGLSRDSALFRIKVLQHILQKLFLARFSGEDLSGELLDGPGSTGRNIMETTEEMETCYSYEESEETKVDIAGSVVTSDGRSIDFNINLEMSRSFRETYMEKSKVTMYQLRDPIVINMDCDTAAVSDVSFRFDLNGDGKDEKVSSLKGGSGFLAIDGNGDGKINDGSELFGARTGDGFKELSELDSDGNGWIDEGDEAWNDLRVWVKDMTGNDKLLTLKEADVGAICLGNAVSEFSLKGEMNVTQAQIRSTGVYLKESGGAGTVQHVDLGVEE